MQEKSRFLRDKSGWKFSGGKNRIRNNYARIEIIFFFVYFFLFSILSDFEYNSYERHDYTQFLKDIPDRLVYGLVYLVPFALCYKLVIWGCLFKKKYIRFALYLFLFFVALHFYLLYSYWVISKLSFLPAQITKDADKYFHAKAVLRYSFAYVLRELLAISCLAYFIRYARQEQQMNAIRQEQLQAELKYLKVQLQPHFFFNTLNNIYALTLERSAAAAPLVAKHAEMMRYILYDTSNPKTLLADEIAFLENYVRVETVRYGEQISISFDKQGIPGAEANYQAFNSRGNNAKDKKRQYLPGPNGKLPVIEPLLLLPFVENAFKHGISGEVSKGYIRIVVCLIGTELILEVMNSKKNGIGIVSRENGQDGIGLKNVGKRLELLYPQKHRLEIKETETDFDLRLTLQLSTHD